mmetsp:Transcript_25346/g.60935  ORF Transcript_25346/g.60935 Transcript_25346/m.60935 type:complete len:97 (+) Transcript_25346:136-426(+)
MSSRIGWGRESLSASSPRDFYTSIYKQRYDNTSKLRRNYGAHAENCCSTSKRTTAVLKNSSKRHIEYQEPLITTLLWSSKASSPLAFRSYSTAPIF